MEKIIRFFKENRKSIIIFFSGVCVTLLITGICFKIYSMQRVEQDKIETHRKEKESERKKEIKKKREEKKINQQGKKETYNPESPDSENVIVDNNQVVQSNSQDTIVDSPKTEEDVIEYFYQQERYTMNGSEQDITVRQRVKDGINTIYNFLFHGGTIYGKTFKELSSSAKLQVLKIALSIDQKVDSYFPNYKESIKEGANNLKSKIVITYLETTNRICSNHEDICAQAREDFQTMKNSFRITFSLIKDLAKSGSTALKEWYLSGK